MDAVAAASFHKPTIARDLELLQEGSINGCETPKKLKGMLSLADRCRARQAVMSDLGHQMLRLSHVRSAPGGHSEPWSFGCHHIPCPTFNGGLDDRETHA